MSIKSFKSTVEKARRINEDAATVVELTTEMKKTPTTFSFPLEGLNYGQLVTELRRAVSPTTKVEQSGDNVVITTTNPTAATKALKGLGVSVNVEGELLNDVHTQ